MLRGRWPVVFLSRGRKIWFTGNVVQDAEKGEPNSDADAIAEFTGAKNEEERELVV
jgi:hypothetical protein